jgi:hypothetical protein
MSIIQLDIQAGRLLLADWFRHLASEAGMRLNQYGKAGRVLTLGDPSGLHIKAEFVETPPYLRFSASDHSYQDLVDSIAMEAGKRIESRDLGSSVWYTTELSEVEFNLSSSWTGKFIERLSNQTHIKGWRKLGSHVLLHFSNHNPTDASTPNNLFFPEIKIKIYMKIPWSMRRVPVFENSTQCNRNHWIYLQLCSRKKRNPSSHCIPV